MTELSQSRLIPRETSVARPSGLVVSYAVFALTAAALVCAFALPFFRVSRVTLVGMHLPRARILAATNIDGKNIFMVQGSGVVQSLRAVPDILVTGVSISLPNTVTIRAQVRRPVMGLKEQGRVDLVDKYGRVIGISPHPKLPTIENDTHHVYRLGGYVPPLVVLAARYAHGHLPGGGVYGFALGIKHGLMLRSGHGWTAILGRPKPRQLVTRIATLRAILAATASSGEQVRCVDLRPRTPYVSPLACRSSLTDSGQHS